MCQMVIAAAFAPVLAAWPIPIPGLVIMVPLEAVDDLSSFSCCKTYLS